MERVIFLLDWKRVDKGVDHGGCKLKQRCLKVRQLWIDHKNSRCVHLPSSFEHAVRFLHPMRDPGNFISWNGLRWSDAMLLLKAVNGVFSLFDEFVQKLVCLVFQTILDVWVLRLTPLLAMCEWMTIILAALRGQAREHWVGIPVDVLLAVFKLLMLFNLGFHQYERLV